MTKIQMVEHAMAELGNASGEAVAAFVEARYGVKIGMQFIPLYTASLRGIQQLEAARQGRGAAATAEAINPTV